MEKLVTDPLEKAIQEIPELDFVASTSKTGISVVSVNIQERYKKLQPIWDNLRRKIDAKRESSRKACKHRRSTTNSATSSAWSLR